MVDNSNKYNENEQSSSMGDEVDDDNMDFILPWRRNFIHCDMDHFATKRDSIASLSSGRPASTPGNFPDMHWLPPLSTVDRSRPEEVEEDSNIKKRVDVWISRLDRLISDSSQADQSMEYYDITPESFSSEDTLVTGSSSSAEHLEEDDEDGEDDEEEEDEKEEDAENSSCGSLDEMLLEAVGYSTFESEDRLMGTELEKPFQEPTQKKEIQPSPKVKYSKGTACSDIFQACEILNTRYTLEDIAVRKPVITWSKWNVSQVVRGPHVNSPIWNPTLKKKWDRPSSIVFQELNKEITRRNEELEQLVKRKTGNYGQRPAPPLHLVAFNSLPPPPPTPSIPPLSSISPAAAASPPSIDDPPDALILPLPPAPCRQPKPAIPPSKVNRSSLMMLEISPQMTSRTDQGGYPQVAMTTDNADEHGSPSSAGVTRASSSSSPSSSSAGMSLLRRMVKSFWNRVLGDGDCHGEASSSSSSSSRNQEASTSMSKMPMPKKNI